MFQSTIPGSRIQSITMEKSKKYLQIVIPHPQSRVETNEHIHSYPLTCSSAFVFSTEVKTLYLGNDVAHSGLRLPSSVN